MYVIIHAISLNNANMTLTMLEDGSWESTTIDEFNQVVDDEICKLFFEFNISVSSIAINYRKTFKEVENIIRKYSNYDSLQPSESFILY